MPRNLLITSILVSASIASTLEGQANELTATDYNRAEQFLGWNAEKLTRGLQVSPTWLEGDRFWYRTRVLDGHQFILVDPNARQRTPAFDHDRLAAALSVAADTSYVGGKLPFTTFEFVNGDRSIQFHTGDSIRWSCDIVSYSCPPADSVSRPERSEVHSPDRSRVAFERDENLWIRDVATGQETQLSTDGEEHYGYGVVPEGCCSEVSNRRADVHVPAVVRWSPDGTKIATHRYDERDVEQLHILETKTGRPQLHSYRYPLPGDSIIPMYDVYMFDTEAGTSLRVDQNMLPGDFTAGDTIWSQVRWSDDGEQLYYLARTRDFTTLELRVADATTGATRTILSESGPTLREPHLSIGSHPNWRPLAGGREILWFSERDGWGHLYRIDAATGSVLGRVTEGPWLVFNVYRVDEAAGWVYFSGMGREEGRDPYFRHLYRARLDGSGVELLTPEDADHQVSFSPSGTMFLDSYSRRDLAPVSVMRDLNGTVIQTVEEADISALLAQGWQPPTPFKAKGRDGVTDVYGYLYFPTDFDPDASYPVIDYVYPGPQIGPIGPRSFALGGWAGEHALPELGFIVFTIDAMGTPWRDKAFHDAYYSNMGDNGIPDHISALRQLGSQYPQMDLDRVGIFGHSGGGFASTDAILRYPDFFKVAVSGAGNHDNRAYYNAWGERYQGLLTQNEQGGDSYDSQANQNLAANLEGKLLLSYGTLDDNVHPNGTLGVINELIRHNKDFDVIVFPNRNHGHAGDPYSIRRTWDYFVEHLLGATPPRQYDLKGPGGE
jgi:dipeptidyl aminopeptidase/acylaminoacyl peptidase